MGAYPINHKGKMILVELDQQCFSNCRDEFLCL